MADTGIEKLILGVLESWGPHTILATAEFLNVPYHTVYPKMYKLERYKYVTPIGAKPRGRKWQITEDGRRWLKSR